MNDQQRRKELRAQYQQTRTEAAVYCIRNSQNNKVLVGSTLNLASIRNKLEFAISTNTPTVLDRRLIDDLRAFGIAAFSLAVLEVLDVRPEMTREEILADLAVLEQLWREKLDPALLY